MYRYSLRNLYFQYGEGKLDAETYEEAMKYVMEKLLYMTLCQKILPSREYKRVLLKEESLNKLRSPECLDNDVIDALFDLDDRISISTIDILNELFDFDDFYLEEFYEDEEFDFGSEEIAKEVRERLTRMLYTCDSFYNMVIIRMPKSRYTQSEFECVRDRLFYTNHSLDTAEDDNTRFIFVCIGSDNYYCEDITYTGVNMQFLYQFIKKHFKREVQA